jgi:hypothetical protein
MYGKEYLHLDGKEYRNSFGFEKIMYMYGKEYLHLDGKEYRNSFGFEKIFYGKELSTFGFFYFNQVT